MTSLQAAAAQRVRSVLRGAQQAIDVLKEPLFVRPGHYYSPVVSSGHALKTSLAPEIVGLDFRLDQQLQLVKQLAQYPWSPMRWHSGPANTMFAQPDAAVYNAILQHVKPTKVLEVGSGFSTAVALDLGVKIQCIEPYPERLHSLLRPEDDVALVAAGVQSVPIGMFEELDGGDVLFIDSTHVAKTGSDVLYLVLDILPRLRAGVVVHVHDVRYPFVYPHDQVTRSWNEAYLLRAFLQDNPNWEIFFWPSQVQQALGPEFPLPADGEGASLWLRKVR